MRKTAGLKYYKKVTYPEAEKRTGYDGLRDIKKNAPL
jgi:hypothetical protein